MEEFFIFQYLFLSCQCVFFSLVGCIVHSYTRLYCNSLVCSAFLFQFVRLFGSFENENKHIFFKKIIYLINKNYLQVLHIHQFCLYFYHKHITTHAVDFFRKRGGAWQYRYGFHFVLFNSSYSCPNFTG